MLRSRTATFVRDLLGVRMALLGLNGIDDPQGKDRKRLVTLVEIDRCATDAVQ